MHVVVFGVGAIGGFYGTKLAHYIYSDANREGHKLSFVARGTTLEVLRTSGLKLICQQTLEVNNDGQVGSQQAESFAEIEENIIVEPEVNVYERYLSIDSINPDETTLVLLCVKSRDTITAAQDILTQVNDKTIVVSVQNGVENEARIASVLGEERVLGALTNVAAEVLEPGIYIQKGYYGLKIGELDGSKSERLQRVEGFLKNAGIEVKTTDQIYVDLWSKLVWNASFNPMSVLHEMTIGPLLADPEHRRTIQGVMSEVKAVAAAQGYQLRDDVDAKHIERTDVPAWYDFRTSMLQDYQKGREIELDDLLGVVVRCGQEMGVATPYATKLYANLVHKLQ